jgi:poly(hydroxyalkanoate) depolymerase family esterase
MVMKTDYGTDMLKATKLTRAGRLKEALAVLRGTGAASSGPAALGRGLLERLGQIAGRATGPAGPAPAPDDGEFSEHVFSNAAGSRKYKLFIPRACRGKKVPLVVMLHGCTQSPDDFAAGTRMNALAVAQGFLVAYPAQAKSANFQKCWNWFNEHDQHRDTGEPSLIAGITRQVMLDQAVSPEEVYVAGLSAGGAAAVVMGATYPDLYAAVGVHSGLACGAAHSMANAFAAMQQGGSPGRIAGVARPTIVFHGDHDATVNAVNADQIIAQVQGDDTFTRQVVTGEKAGLRYTRTILTDGAGRPMHEQWILHGAGHAWSGGSPAGSFTSASGPDASAEMLRFFHAHKALGEAPAA